MAGTDGSGGSLHHAADAAAIALFVYAGELRHGTDPLRYPTIYLDTLAPFLIGWIAVAVVALRVPVADRLPWDGAVGAAVAGAALWLPACLVGLVLRSTALFHGGAPPSFAAVALVGGAIAVAAGRFVTATALRRYMSL